MRKARCTNMHFFDADETKTCPHCGAPEAKEIMETSQDVKKVKNSGIFGLKLKSKNENEIVEPEKIDDIEGEMEGLKTEKIQTYLMDDMDEKEDREEFLSNMILEPHQEQKGSAQNDSFKTVSIFASEAGEEPVAGWLVCVKGKNYGRSFELKMGQNCVGRDFSMDVCLKGEESVSRDKHAYIIFEPKKRQFLLRSGEGKGLTYCNEELVFGVAELKAYDKLQLGDVELLFVPFCGEKFVWGTEDK